MVTFCCYKYLACRGKKGSFPRFINFKFITMKRTSIFVLIGFLTMFLYACSSDDSPKPSTNTGSEFIFKYDPLRDNVYGDKRGFFRVTLKNDKPEIKRLNDFYSGGHDFDVNEQGTVVFTCESLVVPFGAPKNSRLAYFSISKPGDVKFVAPPADPKDGHWVVVPTETPIILKDGRLVNQLNLESDVTGGGKKYHMGIYDPAKNKWTISPDVSAHVLAQPEQGTYTTAGLIKNSTAVLSPDQTKVYITTQGYGYKSGAIQYEKLFVTYYDLATNDFVTVFAGTHTLLTATDKSVYFTYTNRTHAVDIVSKKLTQVEAQYGGEFTGAATHDEIIKVWRKAGLGTYTNSGASFTWKHIINTDKLTDKTYRGLGSKAFYTKDDKEIIFAATTNFETTFDADLAVMKTELIANNPEPEVLFTLPKNFSYHFKMLK